jgi:capsular exopolysaccharide family
MLANQNIKKPDDKEFGVMQDILFRYLSYWPLFAALLALSLTGAWFYVRYKIPVYSITASILIKDEEKGLGESKVLEALDLFGSRKIVDNEIKVLLSKSIAREVVKDLHLYAPVYVEGNLFDRSGYVAAPLYVEMASPDSLASGTDKIQIEYLASGKQVLMNEKSYPVNTWVSTDYGMLMFVPNRRYRSNKPERAFYFKLVPVKSVANKIVKQLKAQASTRQSTVVDLTLKDEVPQRGQDILNHLMAVYNKAAVRDKNTLAANTLQFVEERLKYVSAELDSVESELRKYKERKKITDIGMQGQIFLQTVSANDEKLSETDVQLAVLHKVEDYVLKKHSDGNIVPSMLGITDPVLSSLLEKLYATELQYERLKKMVPDNNPAVITLRNEMDKIRPGILENIRSQRVNLLARQKKLVDINDTYTDLLRSMPEKERELLGISRQQGVKQNIYTFLLQKREEAALSYASTVPDSRIVDEAEAGEKPVSPNKVVAYALALLTAMGGGTFFITMRKIFVRSVYYKTDIEQFTGVPVLGEVMHSFSADPIVIGEGKRSIIAEQFRQLRTSLTYMGINQKNKKVLVTSSIPGEGKTFLAANLGITLALTGKKVVMLELDLRKPQLSRIFGINRNTGISQYLIGEKKPAEILRNTHLPNLFLVPSGPLPPNPSELLLNGDLPALMTYLEQRFDYILIDTAPVNPVTEAFILSPLCDATLFIVRRGYTPKTLLTKLEEYNKLQGFKNIAVIFNDVRKNEMGGYGYSYAGSYSYEYIEEEKRGRKGFARIISRN